MKKDPLREYINKAQEAYQSAAEADITDYDQFQPPRKRKHDNRKDKELTVAARDKETEPLSENKEKQLEIGIDVKYIVIDFMDKLTNDHGERRAERFKYYLQNGRMENIGYTVRCQVKSDFKRLNRIITRYKIDGQIL